VHVVFSISISPCQTYTSGQIIHSVCCNSHGYQEGTRATAIPLGRSSLAATSSAQKLDSIPRSANTDHWCRHSLSRQQGSTSLASYVGLLLCSKELASSLLGRKLHSTLSSREGNLEYMGHGQSARRKSRASTRMSAGSTFDSCMPS
jgi:hypothetical protein